MKRIIQRVQTFFEHYKSLSRKMSVSSLPVKTPIRTYDTLQEWPSQSREILMGRISHRLLTQYSKSIPLTYTTQYHVVVTWNNGVKEEYYFGTLSQVVQEIEVLVTTGMNGLTFQKKYLPSFPHRAGSFLLFSERWPSAISTVYLSPRTQLPWYRTRPRGDHLIAELHSSGRVYSQPSTTT